MTALAINLPNATPLPIVPPPFHDELPVSWLQRIAHANSTRLDRLFVHIGIRKGRLWRIDVEPSDHECQAIASAVRRDPADVEGMTFSALSEVERKYVAPKSDFQFCPRCVGLHKEPLGIAAAPRDLEKFELPLILRHWRYAWSVRCLVCDERLERMPYRRFSTDSSFPEERVRLDLIDQGANILRKAVENENRRLLRRIHLTLNLCCWIRKNGPTESMLITPDIVTRYFGFRAIVSAQSQPTRKLAWLLTTSNNLRGDNIIAALRWSRLLTRRVCRMSRTMSEFRHQPSIVEQPERSYNSVSAVSITKKKRPRQNSIYERAAILAIKENAKLPQRALLRRADQILQDLRKRSSSPIYATQPNEVA